MSAAPNCAHLRARTWATCCSGRSTRRRGSIAAGRRRWAKTEGRYRRRSRTDKGTIGQRSLEPTKTLTAGGWLRIMSPRICPTPASNIWADSTPCVKVEGPEVIPGLPRSPDSGSARCTALSRSPSPMGIPSHQRAGLDTCSMFPASFIRRPQRYGHGLLSACPSTPPLM